MTKKKCRKLIPEAYPEGVTFTITVEQDDTPVRGNAMASGDDAADRECEDEIIRRLDQGDVWAWALVTVTCHYQDFTGRDTLGGCSYEDENDFKNDGGEGYWAGMQRQAYEDLRQSCKDAIKRGENAKRALRVLRKVW